MMDSVTTIAIILKILPCAVKYQVMSIVHITYCCVPALLSPRHLKSLAIECRLDHFLIWGKSPLFDIIKGEAEKKCWNFFDAIVPSHIFVTFCGREENRMLEEKKEKRSRFLV